MGHENVYLMAVLVFAFAALLMLSIGLRILGLLWQMTAKPRAWVWAKCARQRTWLWDNTTRLRHGLMQLFIAFDQLLNVLSNPFSLETWADETLSARCGRLGHRHPYKFWKRIVDALFFWQGPNHCVNAFLKEKQMYHSPPATRWSRKDGQ